MTTLQEYANKRFIETFEKYEQFYLENNKNIQQLQDQIIKKDLEIQRLTELLQARQPKPEPDKKCKKYNIKNKL